MINYDFIGRVMMLLFKIIVALFILFIMMAITSVLKDLARWAHQRDTREQKIWSNVLNFVCVVVLMFLFTLLGYFVW